MEAVSDQLRKLPSSAKFTGERTTVAENILGRIWLGVNETTDAMDKISGSMRRVALLYTMVKKDLVKLIKISKGTKKALAYSLLDDYIHIALYIPTSDYFGLLISESAYRVTRR